MSRVNLEDNIARRLRLLSPTHEVLETVLSGSFIIPDDGPVFYFLDPNGSNRSVFMPEIRPQGGFQFIVSNIGSSGNLEIVDDNGASIVTIETEQVAILFSSYAEWGSVIGLAPEQNNFLVGLRAEPRVVSGDFVVDLDDDNTIAVVRDAPTATAGTLPSVADRDGRPVTITDASTNVVEHTITLTPDGAETIAGQATWTLVSNAANRSSVTLWPSETLAGWYIR